MPITNNLLSNAEVEVFCNKEFTIQGVKLTYGYFMDTWEENETHADLITKFGLKNATGLAANASKVRDHGFVLKSYHKVYLEKLKAGRNTSWSRRRPGAVFNSQLKSSDTVLMHSPQVAQPTFDREASDLKKQIEFYLYYSPDQHKRVWSRTPLFMTNEGKVVQVSFASETEYSKGPLRDLESVFLGKGKLVKAGSLKTAKNKQTLDEDDALLL